MTVSGLVNAQRSVGNAAVVRLLAQRQHVSVQRDWTGDRTDEVRQAMADGDDFNRDGGPWYLLNGHNPEALVGIMRRLGRSGRQELASHPVDGGRYDKARLDLAFRTAASGGTSAQVHTMDAIRNAVAGSITWEECWADVQKLSHRGRLALYRGMSRDELHTLLQHVSATSELVQAALEAEINDVLAPPVKDILLDFVPDASELPNSVTNDPEPLGQITVLLKGKPVMEVPARGGPWKSGPDPNNPGHTKDPTTAGTFTLAAGAPHVTSAWKFSQVANGTPIRDTGTDVEYHRGGRWRSVRKLRVPLERKPIMGFSAWVVLVRQVKSGVISQADMDRRLGEMKAAQDFSPLTPTWNLNDFGREAFSIQGSGGDFLHTTQQTDEDAETLLKPGDLEFSHGCIHILGPDREKLIESGYLRGGVRIRIRPYDPTKLARWGPSP